MGTPFIAHRGPVGADGKVGTQFLGMPVMTRHFEGNAYHGVQAYYPGENKIVGSMLWAKGTGHIMNVNTNDKHRRKGIANSMFNYARSLNIKDKPEHSIIRTSMGDEWANSMKNRPDVEVPKSTLEMQEYL
jgi:hypothetical protein